MDTEYRIGLHEILLFYLAAYTTYQQAMTIGGKILWFLVSKFEQNKM